MLKKIFLSISILCLGTSFGQIQKIKTTLLDSIKTSHNTSVKIDNLGNFYYIEDNTLTKQNNISKWVYNNVSLGKISFIDVINPLKTLVFYDKFNTVILLDNQLNETTKFNISEIDNEIIATNIGMASQNQIWLYDQSTKQVSMLNYLSMTIRGIGNPIQGEIKYFQSDFNYFYWIDKNNNWYCIDIFGKTNLLANIPLYENIQIINNEKILFSNSNAIYYLNTKSNAVFEIDIFENSFENFYYNDQILAIFTDQQIKNLKIRIP